MNRARLLLADDHRIILDGLRPLLEGEFDLVGMVEDGRSLLEAEEQLRPDIVITDISMPQLNGIDAIRQLLKIRKNLKIIVLTMHSDAGYAAAALDAGAVGFVMKHAAASELITAIRSVLQGQTYITPLIAEALQSYVKDPETRQRPSGGKLTARQREVLQLLAQGRPLKEIAGTLNISVRTVEFHKYQMMEELGVKSTADLIRYALKNHIAGE